MARSLFFILFPGFGSTGNAFDISTKFHITFLSYLKMFPANRNRKNQHVGLCPKWQQPCLLLFFLFNLVPPNAVFFCFQTLSRFLTFRCMCIPWFKLLSAGEESQPACYRGPARQQTIHWWAAGPVCLTSSVGEVWNTPCFPLDVSGVEMENAWIFASWLMFKILQA